MGRATINLTQYEYPLFQIHLLQESSRLTKAYYSRISNNYLTTSFRGQVDKTLIPVRDQLSVLSDSNGTDAKESEQNLNYFQHRKQNR